MIDLYCERVGPGIFAEPINTFTNLFFLMAAGYCAHLARCTDRCDAMLLAFLLGAIGIGSAMFHTFATNWAQLLDVIPIALFQITYVWLYLRRIVLLNFTAGVMFSSLFATAIYFASLFPGLLNGSLSYLPSLITLVLIGIFHYWARRPGISAIFTANLLFLVSLAARTSDRFLCVYWSTGTHFIWHSLNALVLALLSYIYVKNVEGGERRAGNTHPT